MNFSWIIPNGGLQNGVQIMNGIDNVKFEHFIRRIVIRLRNKDDEIFTIDERKRLMHIFQISDTNLILIIDTMEYILKNALKYIFFPNELRDDLSYINFTDEKVEIIIKVWSSETSFLLQNFTLSADKPHDDINFSWKLNSEISSDHNKISKTPKAYLSINNNNGTEMELSHSELHSMFHQFESIQKEIDKLLL